MVQVVKLNTQNANDVVHSIISCLCVIFLKQTLGLIGQLKQETFKILDKLQQKMASCIKSVGNIEHEVYRAFYQEHRTKPMAGFIDGDLVEKFIDLPRTQMNDMIQGMKVAKDNLLLLL